MIEYPVTNRFNGNTLFVARIDESETDKSAAAVRWAIENSINLCAADLSEMTEPRPVQLLIDPYPVAIIGDTMQVGCATHTLPEWESFGDRDIVAMNKSIALRWWRANKSGLLAKTRASNRNI